MARNPHDYPELETKHNAIVEFEDNWGSIVKSIEGTATRDLFSGHWKFTPKGKTAKEVYESALQNSDLTTANLYLQLPCGDRYHAAEHSLDGTQTSIARERQKKVDALDQRIFDVGESQKILFGLVIALILYALFDAIATYVG